ncbi:MAG TPA: DoxX family protein [Terriglobia bacterium]|nr:DoxX family protein [Terriglobia bacterium]
MQQYLGRFESGAFTLMRIVLAFLYWSHGPAWLFGWFTERPPAALNSMFGVAGVIEIVCGTLIALGLLTSWAAFIACGEMAVAYYIAHLPKAWMPIENNGEITVALCFGFLYIATRGGGPYSLDAMLGWGRRD